LFCFREILCFLSIRNKAPCFKPLRLKLLPFDFEETCRCFKNLSDEDKALIYGVAGGTPQYLLQMDDKLSVEDNMFRFWYRFVLDNNSIIARGAADLVYKRIEPHLSDYMGKVFEEICKQYLWKQFLSGNCPVEFSSLGRWWGNDPKEKCQTEIDIMGEQDKITALFAECKWTNEKVDLGVLETLVKRSNLFSYKTKHYYLFSKSGFTKGCIDKANEMRNVVLVSYQDMMEEF